MFGTGTTNTRFFVTVFVILIGVALAGCNSPFAESSSEASIEVDAASVETEDPAEEYAGPMTIHLTVDDDGFSLETIFVPEGRPIKLVFRNHSSEERHFHVPDMPASDLYWLSSDHEPSASIEDFVAMFDDDHEHDSTIDDHHDHHNYGSFVDTPPCESAQGECPTGGSLHAHATSYQFDVVTFVADVAGTYDVVCPLHDEFAARVIVY